MYVKKSGRNTCHEDVYKLHLSIMKVNGLFILQPVNKIGSVFDKNYFKIQKTMKNKGYLLYCIIIHS
jgi:hypothetical protein